MPVGREITSAQVSWADSAGADTEKTVVMDGQNDRPAGEDAIFIVAIKNPSSNTDLTVVVENERAFESGDDWAESDRWTLPASSTEEWPVRFLLGDKRSRLKLSNDSALGAGEGFTADVRVEEP